MSDKEMTLPGFRDFGIDVFLKLGGSLLGDIDRCRELARALAAAARQANIVVFPGGGPIDNYIEELDRDLHFEALSHHHLCARAQDQTGLIFAAMCGDAQCFDEPVDIPAAFAEQRIAVMLPMKMIVGLDVFEQSWRITSDTMSLFFAHLLGARRFAILTNVDGLLRGEDAARELVERITARDLAPMGKCVVDECFAPALARFGLEATILNGWNVKRVVDWVHGHAVRGTHVIPG